MPTQVLIKKATILQPGHSRHLKKSDLLISNGKIAKIAASIKEDVKTIEGKDLYVSAGWMDLRTHLTDPGLEHKDDLQRLCETAAAGGFTAICTLPDSDPSIDSKSGIEYLRNRNSNQLTQILPMGALSVQTKGENLAELYDMHQSGAVAFTDADHMVNSGLLRKALMYTKPFKGLIVSFPMDMSIHHEGQVNESENTVTTGLKLSPALAEYTCVKQQLDIAEYCEAPIHFSGISTKESVNLIKEARKKGQEVTCDVSIFNLCLTDEVAERFDSNLKLMPLLRTDKDRKALIKGLKDGVIDAICSNHHPQNVELKKVEFDYADFGSLSHQSFLPMMLELEKEVGLELLIEKITRGPRSIIGNEEIAIEEGKAATLTVFDSSQDWEYNSKTNKSLSSNSYLLNQTLRGKVVAVCNNNKLNLYS
ncbi:amidohydrolase family protein [bacterium]|nr:amidohydrolase family protein [bacterium]